MGMPSFGAMALMVNRVWSDEMSEDIMLNASAIEKPMLQISKPDSGKELLEGKVLYRAVKRILDVAVSLSGIVVLSAVFAGTALAITMEDGGPVLYMQKRIGKNGREFEYINSEVCIRMPRRSMKVSEKNTGVRKSHLNCRMTQELQKLVK